jgi:VWFA-related protein
MRISKSVIFALTLITSVLPSLFTHAQPKADRRDEQKQDEQSLRLGTTEIVLDVVVRDKKGRSVKDLDASDFEVYEDGVRQRVESFRLVLREPAAAGGVKSREDTTARPSPPRGRSEGLSLVALVFDRLSPNARALAHKAATSYANERMGADDFTGVFAIDLSLRTIQPFTDNAQLVKQAIDRAASLSTSTFTSNAEQVRRLSERSASLGDQAATGAGAAASAGGARDGAGAAAAGSAAGQAAAEQMFAEMNTRMLETFETLERDQQGYATTNALLAVVNSLRNLPGRKTVIFFSEGLSLPPAVQSHFRSVISAANRANVTIYPIDAAGLRVESPNAESTREINALGQRRSRQSASGRDDTSGPMMRHLERNEDILRLNPHGGLGQLANETGGFLISETNDLGAGLRRIDEDMRAHYLLTYSPKNRDYDGHFRQISVKLSRPNLDVQARKGYFAINTVGTLPVLDYEASALAASSRSRDVNSSGLQVLGLNFPELDRPGLVPVLAEVPGAFFTFAADKEKRTYNTDFSIVALIRNESQQVVKKLSQHYVLSGPMEQLEAAKKQQILFYREADLAPGRYTIEAVAYDAPSGKASVRSSSVEVPSADTNKLRLSSIAVLKRAERLTAAEQKTNNPFHYGEVLIYPNTGESLRKSSTKQLTFFFTVYTAKGETYAPKLVIEVLQDGRTVGQTSADLPGPDAAGRIQYASELPLEKFQPGAYELKITVRDGHTSVWRSGQFTLAP